MEESRLPSSLHDAVIPDLPPTAYYIPNFITAAEEVQLLNKINNVPLPLWHHLSRRRLQAYPSILTPSNVLLTAPLPDWLSSPIVPRLLSIHVDSTNSTNIFSDSPHASPNHVLVNEYTAGQGIFPHEDGSAYHPVVATVSIGSATVLDVNAKTKGEKGEEESKWRILQERRSLLISTEKMYTDCLHGIEASMFDEELNKESIVNWKLLGCPEAFEKGRYERETRISLTFRDVLQVKSLGKGLGFLRKGGCG